MEELPVIDIASYIESGDTTFCEKVAQILYETSCLIVRDPRVTYEHRDVFMEQMQNYFAQSDEDKKPDIKPEYSYQLGATPEGTEVPRDNSDVIEKLSPENKPTIPTGADVKWRFFWRIGERPENSDFPELNGEAVIPRKFPNWEVVMNQWGSHMLNTVHTVSEMIAIGLNLPKDSFTSKMVKGPHLLAPTGSDMSKFGKIGTVFAGFHYDLNFLTIHGKSNYPGLYIWLRNGTRIKVSVPDGCLLIQAGKQIEWLTGGHIPAGFHEVIVAEPTIERIDQVKSDPNHTPASLWRVSSTLFSHIASDQILQPLSPFNNDTTREKYPPIKTGEQVRRELEVIKLAAPSN